jgi:hypothetical protein
MNHKGKIDFSNGDSYEGMLKDGLMNGYGVYKYSDGS